MSAVLARHLNFSYGNDQIIKDLSFEVRKGEYVGLIGQNGSGKSTLLKLLLGLIRPEKGSHGGVVELLGKPIHAFKKWDKIGYVPQRSGIFDITFPATVEEIVAMGTNGKQKLFHRLNAEDRKSITEALEVVDLLPLRNRLISELSGGQQQRVLIARALAGRPEILFLDEPVVGVDSVVQRKFYDLLKRLNKDMKITLILVSHDLDIVAHEADYLMLMSEGEVCKCTKDMILKDKKRFVALQHHHS